MDVDELVEELRRLWEIPGGRGSTLERHGLTVCLEYSPPQLLFAVRAFPSHRVLISHESQITRTLDAMGISGEAKLGDPDFDSRYVMRNLNDQGAAELFTPQVRELLKRLEPFTELELAGSGYRLLKHVELGKDYDARRAARDADTLVALVQQTSRQRV